MPISSIRNRRPSKKPLYASVSDIILHYNTNATITSLTPTVASRGKPFIDTDGSTYYEYFVHSSGDPLPSGVTINLKTGAISGTPTHTTVTSETQYSTTSYIAVRDARGIVAFKKSAITFIITDPLITTVPGPLYFDGFVGQAPYNTSIFTSIAGGRPPYVYSIVNGALPSGMSINQNTGKIVGSPKSIKRTYDNGSQSSLALTPAVIISVRDFYNTVGSLMSTAHFNIAEKVNGVISPKITITGPLPLTIYFNSFISVSKGVPPYTYFIPDSQTGEYPTGVTLDETTGIISGTYSGVSSQVVNGNTVISYIPYIGTLKVGVKDSTNNIASAVSEVDINAYVPFEVSLNVANQTEITKLATKSFIFKPLKGSNGVKPYVYRIIDYTYKDLSNNISTETVLPSNASIAASDGTITVRTGGIPAGEYTLHFGAVDSTGYEAQNIPSIKLIIRESVVGIPLLETTTYELYVNESSIFDTFTDVMTAELGTPPYNYTTNKRLPAGMTSATVPDITTGHTKYQIKGPITAAGRTNIIVSVNDQIGSIAPEKTLIDFNVKDHLNSPENITDVIAFVGDPISSITLFKSITGGFMPYRALKNTGTLRPELELIASNYNSDLPESPSNGYTYFDTTANKFITEKDIKIWGNEWVDDPVNGRTLGASKTWMYSGTSSVEYLLQDAKGEISPNLSTVNFNIYDRLTWTSSYYMVSGVANVSEINLAPITPINGLPPYKINAVLRRTNPQTGQTEYLPSLGLNLSNSYYITGKANMAFTGTLYYYVTDAAKGRTDDVAVEFNIVPTLESTTPWTTKEMMCVVGTNLYEIKENNVATVVSTFSVPLFTSVRYGQPPYTFYESDSAGKAITSKLPLNMSIDGATGIISGAALNTTVMPKTTIYCTVTDSIPMKGNTGRISITVYERLSVKYIDNSTLVTNIEGTKASNYMSWWTESSMIGYTLIQGVNGSGRYTYSIDSTSTDINTFNQYLKISSTTGVVSLSNNPTTGAARFVVADVFDISFKVVVTDTFTNISIVSDQTYRFKTVSKFVVTGLIYSTTLEVGVNAGSNHMISITGGSEQYEILSVTPGLPTGVSILTTGYLSGTPTSIMNLQAFQVSVRDAVYKIVVNVNFMLKVVNRIANINVSSSQNRTITSSNVATATNLSTTALSTTPVTVNINVTGDVTSTSTSSAAMVIALSTLAPGSEINLIMNANIVGKGGAGGTASSTASSRNGKPGGTGLKLSTGSIPVTIKSGNGGIIAGGGGGGGAGGQMWMSFSERTMYRYLMREIFHFSWIGSDIWATWDHSLDTYEYYFDSTHRQAYIDVIGNAVVDPPNPYTDRIPYTITYNFSPTVSSWVANLDNNPGLQSTVSTVYSIGGARGGDGAYYTSSVTGSNGGSSIKGYSYTGSTYSSGEPTEQDFIDAGFARDLSVCSIKFSSGLTYGYKSGIAYDGTGNNAGLAGIDTPADGGVLWGCAGGGGGGLGSSGGDGDSCLDTPPNNATIYPGGIGGAGGAALDTSGALVAPSIESFYTTIIGDII